MDYYGMRVVGARRPLSDMGDTVSRFQRYLGAAPRVGSPELEIFWDMLYHTKQADQGQFRPDARAADALRFLSDKDQVFFFVKLLQFSVPESWTSKPSFKSAEMARICALVRAAYADSFKQRIADLGDATFAEAVAKVTANRHLEGDPLESVMRIAKELRTGQPMRSD
jgi:hypothetical protein